MLFHRSASFILFRLRETICGRGNRKNKVQLQKQLTSFPSVVCKSDGKRCVRDAYGRFELVCMDGSGCKAPFEEEEIRRFLDAKAFKLLDKLRTENELKKVASLSLRNYTLAWKC
jgi:hypothetical protein